MRAELQQIRWGQFVSRNNGAGRHLVLPGLAKQGTQHALLEVAQIVGTFGQQRTAGALEHVALRVDRLTPGVRRSGALRDELEALQQRLAALGPQQLELPAGTLRGHTFHYSTAASEVAVVARTARPATAPAPDKGESVYRLGAIQASYFHPWFPSSPEAAASLFLAPEASC